MSDTVSAAEPTHGSRDAVRDLSAAVAVLIFDARTRADLLAHDPQALMQAERAVWQHSGVALRANLVRAWLKAPSPAPLDSWREVARKIADEHPAPTELAELADELGFTEAAEAFLDVAIAHEEAAHEHAAEMDPHETCATCGLGRALHWGPNPAAAAICTGFRPRG